MIQQIILYNRNYDEENESYENNENILLGNSTKKTFYLFLI